MDERPFDQSSRFPLDDDSATTRAADLAERILDEISRPHHDWGLIGVLADVLARLASEMAHRPHPSPPDA